MTKGGGGRIWNGPQKDDVIYEQPLMGYLIHDLKNRVSKLLCKSAIRSLHLISVASIEDYKQAGAELCQAQLKLGLDLNSI